MKNNSALFYVCALIEYIGRKQRLRRIEVVKALGEKTIQRIYSHADVLHCEPIEKVADEYISLCEIETGVFDNVAQCRYRVPDYWTIGEVYERLIEDVAEDNVVAVLLAVYSSWISDAISNYNSDFFYQSRDYIKESYMAGYVL